MLNSVRKQQNFDEGIYESKCHTPTRLKLMANTQVLTRKPGSHRTAPFPRSGKTKKHIWCGLILLRLRCRCQNSTLRIIYCIMLVEAGILWKRVFIVIVIHLIIFCSAARGTIPDTDIWHCRINKLIANHIFFIWDHPIRCSIRNCSHSSSLTTHWTDCHVVPLDVAPKSIYLRLSGDVHVSNSFFRSTNSIIFRETWQHLAT